MMDDFNKIFGIGLYEKLLSQNNSIDSIAALSNPLKFSNWILKSDENLAIKAITGNTLQLWGALTKMPRVADYSSISAIMGTNHLFLNLENSNPILNSLTNLSSKMNWLAPGENYPKFSHTNDWSKSLLMGNTAIEILSKSEGLNNRNKSNYVLSNLLLQKPFEERKIARKDITVKDEIERFASNITAVYSEVEKLNESQQIKFASNITDTLTYQVNSTKDLPTYISVLEWILNKYNIAIENAIVARNIEDLKNIYKQLKAISIVGWLAIIISTAMLGVIENQGGKLWENFTSAKADMNSTDNFKTVVPYNSSTNNATPLRIEPDGRTKIICIIPDCTEVQLGEIFGKYIQVSVLINGSLKRGWCLNKEFVKPELPH